MDGQGPVHPALAGKFHKPTATHPTLLTSDGPTMTEPRAPGSVATEPSAPKRKKLTPAERAARRRAKILARGKDRLDSLFEIPRDDTSALPSTDASQSSGRTVPTDAPAAPISASTLPETVGSVPNSQSHSGLQKLSTTPSQSGEGRLEADLRMKRFQRIRHRACLSLAILLGFLVVALDAHLPEDQVLGWSVTGFWALFILEAVLYFGLSVLSRTDSDSPHRAVGQKPSDGELEMQLRSVLGLPATSSSSSDGSLSTILRILEILSKVWEIAGVLHRFAMYLSVFFVTGILTGAVVTPLFGSPPVSSSTPLSLTDLGR